MTSFLNYFLFVQINNPEDDHVRNSSSSDYDEAAQRANYLQSVVEQQAGEIKEMTAKISQLEVANKLADPDTDWEVDEILDMRYRKNGNREFLIRWKDYDSEWDSWVPERNLSCDDQLSRFFHETEFKNSIDGEDNGGADDDDKNDKDYKREDNKSVQLPIHEKSLRRSSRISKPPETFEYKPKPSCYECGRSASDVILPDNLGAIFCSLKCSQIWEKR